MNPRWNYKRDLFLCITCFFFAFLLMLSAGRTDNEAFSRRIAPKLLRFHVLANSNSHEDQALKLKVRTRLLALIYDGLGENASLDETKAYIENHQTELTDEAEAYIREAGYDYPVKMELATCYFPTKAYGDMVFPCGDYEALRVEIGQAKGHNWWCVLYPPLCFVDASYAVVPDSSKEVLSNALGAPDYERLLLGVPGDGRQAEASGSTAVSEVKISGVSEENVSKISGEIVSDVSEVNTSQVSRVKSPIKVNIRFKSLELLRESLAGK